MVKPQTGEVTDAALVDRLLALWTTPADDPAAFAELYTDPVVVNGSAMSVADLVERARRLQCALSDLRAEILQVVAGHGSLALAFVMHGRHTGTYASQLGPVPASGRTVAIRSIDVLTLTKGKISRIWVNADDLGLLRQMDAVVQGSTRAAR